MAKAKIGRPRSEKARNAIFEATRELLREKGGGGLSIEAVARRAGVGKPTIYRWWPTLADLVLDVLLRQADAEIPVPSHESLQETLCEFLRQSVRVIQEGCGLHLRFLMAQAQMDTEFRERFRENFVARRRDVLRSIFLKAADRGQIDPRYNPELLVDIVFGAMWYRLLVGHAAMDESFADELTQAVVGLMSADSA